MRKYENQPIRYGHIIAKIEDAKKNKKLDAERLAALDQQIKDEEQIIKSGNAKRKSRVKKHNKELEKTSCTYMNIRKYEDL